MIIVAIMISRVEKDKKRLNFTKENSLSILLVLVWSNLMMSGLLALYGFLPGRTPGFLFATIFIPVSKLTDFL